MVQRNRTFLVLWTLQVFTFLERSAIGGLHLLSVYVFLVFN